MSDTTATLRRKITGAFELQSVVRTMKAIAASSIGQYEQSVRALNDYQHTVALGLGACFRKMALAPLMTEQKIKKETDEMDVIVFGSDQGLVGQFNDVVVEYAVKTLATLPGKPRIWAIGERVQARLIDAGLSPRGLFSVPTSVKAITPFVGKILLENEARHDSGAVSELHLFYNHTAFGAAVVPTTQRLLPLDESWHRKQLELSWPTKSLPDFLEDEATTLQALIHEYLFVSLFRACAESLASENASRLAGMQRADKNIEDLLERLNRTFSRLRQSSIDEELFDVVSGFEALSRTKS